MESPVNLLSRNHFSLLGLLVVNRVGQGVAIIQDGDLVLGIDTNSDEGIAQGIGWALGLDLVNSLLELEGEIFGKRAGFLPGQNPSQLVFGRERAMGIHRTSRVHGKALVEVCDELGQIGIAIRLVGDAVQPHFFGQAILQSLNDPFDPAFGLRAVGANDLNIQFLHGSPKLRQRLPRTCGGHIHPKNTVTVAVEGDRLAMALEIVFRRLAVAEKTLALRKKQLDDLPGRIVDEDQ